MIELPGLRKYVPPLDLLSNRVDTKYFLEPVVRVGMKKLWVVEVMNVTSVGSVVFQRPGDVVEVVE